VDKTSDKTVQTIDANPVGRRYRSLFGPNVAWRTDGLEGLLAEFEGTKTAPRASSRSAPRHRRHR
jgi:hypothetical protein